MLKEKISLLIIKITFAVVGVLIFLFSVVLAKGTLSFISNSEVTTGEVIGLSSGSTKRSVIRYVVENNGGNSEKYSGEYIVESSVGSNPPQHKIGDAVSIRYKMDNPGDSKVNSFLELWFAVIVTGILAVTFMSIGFGMIGYSFYRKKVLEKLKVIGVKIETVYQGVERNSSVSVNGKIPYQIVSHFKDTSANKIYIFKSDNLWFDPSDYIQTKNISVLVDPQNYKKYHMDISFLPKIG